MSNINLRLPDIKTFLYETLGRVIEAYGYKFKKANFSFKRKNGKNYEVIYFLFYDYFPRNYQIQFLLEVWNNDIEVIKAALPYKQNIESFNFRSLSIPMGEFVDKERIRHQLLKEGQGFFLDNVTKSFARKESVEENKDLTWAQIAGYSCELVTNKDLFETSDDIKKILEQQVIPLSYQLSTVEGIDTFFSGRSGWSVNSLSLNNFTSELIAAKLSDKRDYHLVFKKIVEEIDKKIQDRSMNQETKKVIEELYMYLQK